MSFATLKRNRKQNIEQLAAKAQESASGKKNYDDDRFWKPTRDKAGNGYAEIQFLPAPNDHTPWTDYFDHGFKGPTGQFYIEKSLTSIGQPDPLAEFNSKLWNSTTDENGPERKQARQQKRRQNFVSNIRVVNDPANPENNGKVFLYKYGKKIFNMLMDAMNPQFEDEEPINPFDMWDCPTFKIKIRQVEGWPNYDKSEFSASAPIADTDEEIEAIYNKTYDLAEFKDPATYKSYDELKARLEVVLGMKLGTAEEKEVAEEKLGYETPQPRRKEKAPETEEAKAPVEDDEDEDETMSFFQSLANED